MKTLNFSKRLLCMVITVSLVTFIGVPFVSAETEEFIKHSGPFEYIVQSDGATITECDPSVEGHLDIPETLDGHPVVRLGARLFESFLNLTSITIPQSVTTIDAWAFANTGLTAVTIPETVTEIGTGAFGECLSLTSIYVREANLNYTSIEGVLFTKDLTQLMQYPSGKKDPFYSIPNGVKEIPLWSFADNAYLQEIVLPNTVNTVEEYAFYLCVSLTDVTVPVSVTQIGEYALGCSRDYETDKIYFLPDFTIHGYAGTVAEQYCLKDDLDFDVLNQKGDNNHDDTINAKDALVALQLAVNKIESTPGLLQVTDVNGDTHVNAKDALEILKKAVGKPACF